ncbi:MAG: GGDEF domain-containing protein [Limisphaera sp.]|nr:MAG: GGDEF domain-containing protein [Limisphaera sp.]
MARGRFWVLCCMCWAGLGALPAAVPRGPVEMTVRVWRPENGLPDRTVTAVWQTRDGYLWVGTPKGLVRFDGVRFRPLSPSGVAVDGALGVTVLCEDRRGRLWVGTQSSGLFVWEGEKLEPVALPVGPSVTVHTVTAGADGTIWVGTGAGLVEWRNGRSRLFTVADGLPHDTISQVSLARNGDLWITTAGGICQWQGGRIRPVRFEAESTGRSPEFLGVYEDRQGNLWAFGDTYLVNLTEGKRVNYFRSGDVTSVRIWTLWEGRDGRLWIGTSGQGLFYFTGERFVPLTLRSGTLPNDVRALCEDQAGNLWLGTGNSGLVCLSPTRIWVHGAESGLPSGPVILVASHPAGRLWVGVEGHGLWVRNGDNFQSSSGWWRGAVRNLVSAVAFEGPDRMWVGTAGAGLYEIRADRVIRYGTADGLISDEIGLVEVDLRGGLWVAPSSGGLQHWDPASPTGSAGLAAPVSERVTALMVDGGDVWLGTEHGRLWRREAGAWKEISPGPWSESVAIRSLCRGTGERVWVGTDRGLACWTGLRWLVQTWEEPDLVPVRGLQPDAEGGLWWSTGRSVYQLSARVLRRWLEGDSNVRPRRWLAAAQRSEDGLRWGWPQSAATSDGRLWFATESGLVSVRTEDIPQEHPAPAVRIENLVVNGEAWPVRRSPEGGTRNHARASQRLPANLGSLLVEFTAPLPAEGDRVRFQHRLEGFDPDWVDDGPERRIRYGRLPGGHYRLQIRARSEDGSWESQVMELAFLVPTPFWRSIWGMTLWAVLLAGTVAGVVRWLSHRRLRRQLEHLAQQEAMHKERMRIARDMHDELGSKLTRISFLSERALLETKGADPTAGKLQAIATTSRALLQALDEIVWAVNPSNDSVEHLVSYLAQYATEYFQGTPVECQLRLPRQVPHVPLSAEVRHEVFLACEEALSNVLKHARATRVHLEMQASQGSLIIRVEDDGQGFEPPTNPGPGQDGLRNMHRRMSEIGGYCRVTGRPGRGTVVELSFPLPQPET